LHVGMRRGAIKVKVLFLDVFPVVAFIAGQAEQPLLEDRIPAVPESNREAYALVTVADSRDPVLVPPIRAGASMVVRKILPRFPGGAVILSHRAPGPLAQIRSPPLPMPFMLARF